MRNDRNAGVTRTLIFLMALSMAATMAAQDPTPVARWGALHVQGTQLTSQNGEAVALRGMSLFDTSSYGQFSSVETLAWLRDDWKSTVFRAAMYTKNSGTFVGEGAYKGMEAAIDAAIATGLYVLVDWHILSDGNPQIYEAQAAGFFERIATKYKGVPNLIYEICNEPNGNGVTWSEVIKPYALRIIPLIRAQDPRAVIVVGNPNWSSQPDLAARDPLPFDNVLYTQHMYVASHPLGFVGGIDAALAAGAGVFVTEWGTMENSGNSALSPARSWAFVRALADRKVSWAAWQLGTKLEAASTLKPNASPSGNWAVGDLTDNGLLMRQLLRGETSGPIFADNFESGNFKAGGWIREGAYLDKTVVASGSGALRFEGKSAMRKVLASEGARDWTWSFQGRGEGWGKNDRLLVEWSNDGEQWNAAATVSKPTTKWSLVEGTLPATATGAAVQWRLRSEFVTTTARYWIDDTLVAGSRG